MKLLSKIDYSKEINRRNLAKFLSNTIEGKEENELPYCPNDWDTHYFTLDLMNNWKVKFCEESPFIFSIIHRYQCAGNQFEEALAGWLEYKLGVKRV